MSEKPEQKTEKSDKGEKSEKEGRSSRNSISKQQLKNRDKSVDIHKKSSRSLKRNNHERGSNKDLVIDRKPLEEFMSIMDQWQKVARGENLGNSAPAKPHSFVEAAKQAVAKFAQNNNVKQDQEMDDIQAVLQIVIEQRTRVQEEQQKHLGAYRASLSITQTVRQFLQVFVTFYHILASDQPFFGDVTSQDKIDSYLKSIYESHEEELGWTLEEEHEVYKTLPIKGEFPPPDYRQSNFEEYESKLLPELVRPANEKLHTLPSLLRRFESEYAFRSSFISVPDVDTLSMLNKGKVPPGVQSGDLRNPLAMHIATEYSKIYSSEWRGGNLFAATRAALCFLFHAQAVLDVLARIPTFKPLIESARASSDAKHPLDLLKNLPIASAQLGQKAVVQPGSELQFVRKRSSMMNYDNNKTIFDMFKEVEEKKILQCQPRTDLVHALIAMFFDTPYNTFKDDLEKLTRDLQLTQPAFFSSSLHFAPLFMHQDNNYLSEFFARNPTSEYSQAFLTGNIGSKEEKKEKDNNDKALLEAVSKSGTSSVLLTKTGIPLALSPHKYSSENASLFRQLSDNSQKVAETVHQLGSLDPLERAQLLSSLLRQSTGPDIVGNIQSSSDPSEYEEKSINYVNRRNISGGVFEMLRSTLRSVSSYAYPYCHQHELSFHTDELIGRYASLLLGYSHAHAEHERPKDKIFLDIDYIIPFLYRNRHAILDPSKHRTLILGVEFEFFKSPLVQLVIRSARETIRTEFIPMKIEEAPAPPSNKDHKDKDPKRATSTKIITPQTPPQVMQVPPRIQERKPINNNDNDLTMDAHTIINNLYALWEESKLENHTSSDLNNFIIKLLAGQRYDQVQIRKILKDNLDKAENEVQYWVTAEKELESLSNFIGKYGSLLSDPNQPLPDNLCPMMPKPRESHAEEAQLPAEVY